MDIVYTPVPGSKLSPYLDDLAHLRITVFREFPYLYDGNAAYEKKYLEVYLKSHRSMVILARAGSRIIGASTCIPLEDEDDAFKKPFLENGYRPETILYFGESVILPEFRGKGSGAHFFKLREAHAQMVIPDLHHTAFCAVNRPENHPLRPENYSPLHRFWRHQGYTETSFCTQLPWKDIDQPAETFKELAFWLKAWKKA